MKNIGVLAGLLLLSGVAAAADNQTTARNAVVEGSAIVTDGPYSNWGAGSPSMLAFTAWDARPCDSSVRYDTVSTAGGQGITRTVAGNPYLKLPLHLPSGALVTALEFNYCDTGTGTFSVHWFRQAKNAPPEIIWDVILSSGTPGCVVQTATFTTPLTIDNDANSYNIELQMEASDGTIVFLSGRVIYKLQVSPAPATATFPNDVPTTHQFFRFIEALAASGVTGGCGVGSYCPDQPVTRGQMAVFLATALGLHYPN